VPKNNRELPVFGQKEDKMSNSITKTAMAVACFILIGTIFASVGMASADWTSLGPDGGPIACGAISSGSSPVCYVAPASDPMHLLKSDDGGANWTTTMGTGDWLSQLAVAPSDPNTVFGLAGSRVYRSANGGQAWNYYDLSQNVGGYDLAVNPRNGQVLYVAGTRWCNNTGQFICARSTDAGETWTTVQCGVLPDPYAYALSVTIDPVDTNIIYVGGYAYVSQCYHALLYKSSDCGQTWTPEPISSDGGLVYALHVSPLHRNVILAGTAAGIYRSADAGVNWTHCNIYGNSYRIVCVPGDPGVLYSGSDDKVYRSQDEGITWSQSATGIEGHSIKTLLTQAGNNSTVYCGSTAGMFKSVDDGAHWQPIDHGIRVGQIPVVAVSPTDPGLIYVQVLNDAIYKSPDFGGTWQRQPAVLSCGNICSFCFDPTDPQRLWMLEGQG
jgi:photosystem II stability/assembly factor-like uncharacterized protein